MKISANGLAWYKREQWEDFKKYCTDSNDMSESYDSWLEGATDAVEQMKDRNITLYKIVVDLEDFKEYCKKENLEPNGNARTSFVNLKVFQFYKNRELEPLRL